MEQASLAAGGLLAGIGVGLLDADMRWLVGALLLGGVIPFTLLAIMPTNKRLMAPGLNVESPEAAALLRRWGVLHAVRSGLGLAAFGIFVWLLVARDAASLPSLPN